MTYRELFYKATRLINNNKITLGEYEEMTKPLDREVEQEPFKPMVEIDLDYVIKQKYIERKVLDKIRAEIEAKCCITVGRENDGAITLHDVFEIIDKYKGEINRYESRI